MTYPDNQMGLSDASNKRSLGNVTPVVTAPAHAVQPLQSVGSIAELPIHQKEALKGHNFSILKNEKEKMKKASQKRVPGSAKLVRASMSTIGLVPWPCSMTERTASD